MFTVQTAVWVAMFVCAVYLGVFVVQVVEVAVKTARQFLLFAVNGV